MPRIGCVCFIQYYKILQFYYIIYILYNYMIYIYIYIYIPSLTHKFTITNRGLLYFNVSIRFYKTTLTIYLITKLSFYLPIIELKNIKNTNGHITICLHRSVSSGSHKWCLSRVWQRGKTRLNIHDVVHAFSCIFCYRRVLYWLTLNNSRDMNNRRIIILQQ